MSIDHDLRRLIDELAEGRYGLTLVNQRQHALQSALLAERGGESPDFILAALLHDVGHMLHNLGENPAADGIDDGHENIGAAWLAKRFGPAVSEPVRLHVAAKRYLVATESDYAAKLSDDTVLSLSLQGGPMSDAEATTFAALPHAAAAIRLRRIDEAAKDSDGVTPDLSHFLALIPALA